MLFYDTVQLERTVEQATLYSLDMLHTEICFFSPISCISCSLNNLVGRLLRLDFKSISVDIKISI